MYCARVFKRFRFIAVQLINLDFADVKTIMATRALLLWGSVANGERAVEAARMAIASPLLELLSTEPRVLLNITGACLGLFDNEAAAIPKQPIRRPT